MAEQWAKGRRRALIIGISDYEHLLGRDDDPDGKEKAYDLRYADRDALAVSKLLEEELGYDSVTCLTESKATKDSVSRAISRLKRESRPLDSLFVFFSGHGFRDRNRSYFMPWDAELNKLKYDGIRLEDIIGDLEASPAQHKFLVLDCCHSGGAGGKAMPRASFSSTQLKQFGGKGLYILTSCTTEQESWEDETSKQGYFTRFFLEGIQKGNADKSRWGNRDGLLSGEELYLYIYEKLPDQVRRDLRREQQPQRKPPEVGQTLIAKVGKVFGGEVVFRLKSIPGGATVVVNDKQRGLTPKDADTPLEITLELAMEQKVVVSRDGFNPWERTLNPQRREPVELTAVLRKEGVAIDQRYGNAIKLYKKKADAGVTFLELLIEENAPDAPKALLYLCREHHLQRKELPSAIEKADKLREKYGALDESAQADKALFQYSVSKFEKDTAFNRSIDGQQALAVALQSFIKSQPENRYVKEAHSRIEKARSSIHTHYVAAASRLLKRFEGDLEDGLFTAAEARLKAYEQLLDEAEGGHAGLKLDPEKTVETLRVRMAKRKAFLAEKSAWRKATAQASNVASPDLAIKPWETFLASWPRGTMAERARESLQAARSAAKQWHQTEYEKAIGKAKAALDKGDFALAETAVAQALKHRPDDASAKAIQNQLVPILAEMTAWRKANAEAQNAADADLAIKPWESFLASWPRGNMSERAQQSLNDARSTAEQWHKAEYEKTMRKAIIAVAKGDFAAAETAVSQALKHRPNDAAAKAIQNQLVPILVISSVPSDASVTLTPTRLPSTPLPARIRLKKNKSYTITVSKKGYRTETRSLRTTRGGEYPLVVKLEKLKLPGKKSSNSIGMDLVLIPAGEFQMGSGISAAEVARRFDSKASYFEDEHPQHTVKISRPYYLSTTEVTQGQYEAVMGKNPSRYKGKDLPVETVSWEEAVEFCKRLSANGKKGYRLPTEAEWEYACRAGSKTVFGFGDSHKSLGDYAWYSENMKGLTTAAVATKKPNAWGLYDMHGNVFEWCSDWHGDYSSKTVVDPTGPTAGDFLVIRGGGWFSPARGCRSARRLRDWPADRSHRLGFRVALPSQPEALR